jgi:hypothetical protein
MYTSLDCELNQALRTHPTTSISLSHHLIPSRIAELADIIVSETKVIDDYLQSHDLSTPSFDINGPLTLPIPDSATDITKAQYEVIACTEELNELMKGPSEVLWARFVSLCLLDSPGLNDANARLLSIQHWETC